MHFSTLALATSLLVSAFSSISAQELKAIAYVSAANSEVTGTISFSQEFKHGPTWVYANITGLTPGDHGLHIHQFGDLSNGCISTGPHYNPHNETHGGPEAEVRHVGDFGNIVAQENGIAILNITTNSLELCGKKSIIGRGIVVHENIDDLGLGGTPLSNSTGNAGGRIACGVIGYPSV
ncbi:hypothetical protein MFLAVUS_008898 [Mucor flavus]|uniref:Superoxide dismutase [Cu-Zn] n=1 Tax=Mucor flavus TaxID=439312 RepID=A0ABP9Z8E2_9FUNG